MYYEMTLEQRWEKIYTCEQSDLIEGHNAVVVDVPVERQVVAIGGREGGGKVHAEGDVVNGLVWYKGDQGSQVGLSLVIVERMEWEEKRVGWVNGGKERKVRVKKVEEYGGKKKSELREFGCYVLVERFVLKRMDGSLVLTCDFRLTHQIRSRWE